MSRRAVSGKPKSLGSGGSMVAKLKLKEIDGRAPPGVDISSLLYYCKKALLLKVVRPHIGARVKRLLVIL